jgi:hypothetical protein
VERVLLKPVRGRFRLLGSRSSVAEQGVPFGFGEVALEATEPV